MLKERGLNMNEDEIKMISMILGGEELSVEGGK